MRGVFMLLPFQGVDIRVCALPRVSLRLPWAMCLLGFQPVLCIWLGADMIGGALVLPRTYALFGFPALAMYTV